MFNLRHIINAISLNFHAQQNIISFNFRHEMKENFVHKMKRLCITMEAYIVMDDLHDENIRRGTPFASKFSSTFPVNANP